MSNLKNIPDFLVIGSQKCATSWLYDCLKEHPQICMPKHKREVEYIGGQIYKEKGIAWYLSLFEYCTGKKIRGDVSVEYIVNKESPKLLFDLNPDLKFILNVRDPVDRAVSALKWFERKKTISATHADIKAGLNKAIIDFDKKNYNLMEYGYHDVLYRGLYKKLLKNYYAYFKAENILVLHYENIKKSPVKTLQTVFSFLGVEQGFIPSCIKSQPKKNSNNKFLIKVERTFPKNKFILYLIDKLHQVFPEKKSASAFEKEIRFLLNEFYSKREEEVSIKYFSENNINA